MGEWATIKVPKPIVSMGEGGWATIKTDPQDEWADTPGAWDSTDTAKPDDSTFGADPIQKLKDFGEARAKRTPGQAFKEDALNAPLLPVSAGYLAQKARNVFGGKPTTFENTQANPTIGGLVHGLGNIPIGLGQMAAAAGEELRIPYAEESATRMREAAKGWDETFKDPALDPSKSGVMLGESLPYLLTGGGAAATEAKQLPRFLQYAKEAAQRGAAGGIINAIQPDPVAMTDEEYARNAWDRAKIGGAVGVGAPIAAELGGRAVGWGADKLAGTPIGNIRNPFTGNKLIPTELNPEFKGVPERMVELKNRGLSPTIGGVSGEAVTQGEQAKLLGASKKATKYLAKGNTEALADAESEVGKFTGKVGSAEYEGLPRVKRAAEGAGKRAEAAKQAIEDLESAEATAAKSGDYNPMAQAAGNVRYVEKKLIADQKIKKVSAIMDATGPADVSELSQSIADDLAKLKGNTASDLSVRAELERIQNGLKAATAKPPTTDPAEHDVYGTMTKPERMVGEPMPPGDKQRIDFTGLRELRTELMSKIKGLVGGQTSPSKSQLVPLQKTVKAIEKTLADHVENGPPEAKPLYDDFLESFKRDVVPYKDVKFGKALAADDPQSWRNIFKGGNAYQKEKALELLGDKGRAAMKATIIKDVVSGGTRPAQGLAGKTYDPVKIAKEIDGMEKNGTLEAVFKGDEADAVRGLGNIARSITEMGNVKFNPETGAAQALYPTPAGAMHYGTWHFWNKMNEGRFLKLYTDPNSRLMLQRAGKLTPGSKGFIELMEDFAKTANDKGQLP